VTVELQGAGADGVYSESEIGEDGTVTALVTLGETVRVGDTLVVVDGNGTTLLDRTVTQDDLNDGVQVEVPVGEDASQVEVVATVTNPAGNSGTDNDVKDIGLVPTVTVELQGAGADGVYSESEDRKSTRLNASHVQGSYAVLCET